MLFKDQQKSQRAKFIMIFILCGLFFWSPFLLLEKINYSQTGITADQLYSANDSDIQAPIFGKFWGESTKGVWLIWSLIAAPGYSLPAQCIAHGVRNFGIQFREFVNWLEQNSVNEHVLLCGSLGFILSLLLLNELKKCWPKLNLDCRISLCCFYTLPFVGLAILAFKYEWNYLLYHAHTFEFWLMLCVPTFVAFSRLKIIKTSTVVLLAFMLVIPISNSFEKLVRCSLNKNNEFISNTEKERGLSSSRFSEAIDYIESDSNNNIDIIYFLPSGDMGDLILRSKMRVMATHFAGDNFPKLSSFKTSTELNVYLAYDKKLALIPNFLKATTQKFPNSDFENKVLKGNIIVRKIKFLPSSPVS